MKYLFFFLSALVLLSSCTDHGQKIQFGKSEVYYKGEGVTEKQAQKLGDYLEEQGLFEGDPKSVQLTHDGEDFLVHLIVDDKKFTETSRRIWWKLQHNLSEEVFNGKPVRIALSDDKFNDKEVLNPISSYEVGESKIYYDNSEYKKADVKSLADFLVSYKILGEEIKTDVLLEKEESQPIVRWLVNPKKLTDDNMVFLAFLQDQMRETVFDSKKAKFILSTAEYEDLDPLPKLTAEQKQAFLAEINKTNEPTNEVVDTTAVENTSSGVLRLPND